MKPQRTIAAAMLGITLAAATMLPAVFAAEAKPKYTTEEVMKALHKGDDSVGKRVSKGQGTKEDFAKMVEYYASLPLNKPPRGEQASWNEKTAALLKAAKGLQSGAPNALAEFKEASNCKACHSAHKPEKEKH